MMLQRQQRPACKITVLHTAPPLFVETTQAEFRAVVQRLTGSDSIGNGNNRNSNSLKSAINLPSRQSRARSTELPTIAASNRRRPRACARVPNVGISSSGSSESPCDTSDDAVAGCVTVDADDDYNSTSCNKALVSCSKKIKVGVCHSDDGADQDVTANKPGEQHQELDIYDIIDDGVNDRILSLLDNILPEASSTTCTPSTSTAATISSASSSSSLHANSPASLSAASHAGPGSPASDPPDPLIISGSTGQPTAVSHDDDDDDEDYPGRFFCDPASLPLLVDGMAADEQQQQQLELLSTLLYSSSTSPVSTVATSPPASTAQCDSLDCSFDWKDDDFLCV